MSILITGGQGQLAKALQQCAAADTHAIIAPNKTLLDITDEKAVNAFFETHAITLVINTAAYTLVDQAETARDAAYAVNVSGVAALAHVCAEKNIPLIHFSTDYLFDGKQSRPYIEEDPQFALNYYGQTKRDSETVIAASGAHAIVIRISGVFSEHGQNFVTSILKAAQRRDRLQVVADQITCPTAAHDIAKAVWRIVDTLKKQPDFSNWGIYHFCSAPATSWYHFAETLCVLAAQYGLISSTVCVDPIDTETLARPAKRPAYAVLDCYKIRHVFGITQPNWARSLEDLIIRAVY